MWMRYSRVQIFEWIIWTARHRVHPMVSKPTLYLVMVLAYFTDVYNTNITHHFSSVKIRKYGVTWKSCKESLWRNLKVQKHEACYAKLLTLIMGWMRWGVRRTYNTEIRNIYTLTISVWIFIHFHHHNSTWMTASSHIMVTCFYAMIWQPYRQVPYLPTPYHLYRTHHVELKER
jgi:hypothetical protein